MPLQNAGILQRTSPVAFVAAGAAALLLCAVALVLKESVLKNSGPHGIFIAFGLAVLFGSGVILLRAATLPAALCGMLIAFVTWLSTGLPGFASLFVLFVTTWAATRAGREYKRRLGTAEGRRGRKASQVLANLGAFGMLAGLSVLYRNYALCFSAGAAAALAEAAGDTISSELGQLCGGTPYLITSFKPVPRGTDGGVTFAGSAAGGAAVALVLATWSLAAHSLPRWAIPAAAGAFLGIMFDSLLEATLERRGYLNNDGVNFFSTCFAAALAMALMQLL